MCEIGVTQRCLIARNLLSVQRFRLLVTYDLFTVKAVQQKSVSQFDTAQSNDRICRLRGKSLQMVSTSLMYS
ncbi:hypothetical protein SAMN04488136_11981 [Vibrio xiamenensis]|uniref:Uncharacterized protein n=1 Tax=Vibrio xiamenensis TaxID=861298 RepID=A0A1G8DDX5_9VIBR|nr:hypothetical protein SAMN04488136_11981 [Vibrio xiamenensis]